MNFNLGLDVGTQSKIFIAYSFLFGALVGSFLNVVIHRLPREESVVKPRSRCPHCQHQLRWYENIPIFSYLALKGRCSNCGAGISIQYPIVEFATAVAFAATFQEFNVTQIREWVFIAIGISVAVIDFHHRIIPDELSIGGWAFALATSPWDRYLGWQELAIASAVGFGLFLAFAMGYEKITGRVGLGGGDIKLMGPLGAFLGLGGLWATILISSVFGVLGGMISSRFQKNKDTDMLKTTIPYGPFLILGAFCEYFWGISKWLNLNLFP